MNLGLDYYGTIETNPRAYTKLAQTVLDSGGKVYIVTAVASHNEKLVRREIARSHVPYTEIVVITYVNHFEVPSLKKAKALELKLDLMVDDRRDVCLAINIVGILAVQSL